MLLQTYVVVVVDVVFVADTSDCDVFNVGIDVIDGGGEEFGVLFRLLNGEL